MAAGEIVAVLFTDLVGSTALYDRLGDPAADSMRRNLYDRLRAAIQEHRGTEVKSLGDGLMVVFPSAVSALDAAVAMQRDVARRRGAAAERMQIRVGVHVGEALRDGDDYHGMAVTVARRLCDVAAPGQVLVSDVVRALVRPHGEKPLVTVGELTLKGVSEPIEAFEAVWAPGTASGAVALPTALADPGEPLVARADEMATVLDALEGQAGGVRLSLVRGEPGIGKTRLAVAVAEALHARGAVVLYGRCDEDGGLSFQPFLEALSHLARHVEPDELRARLGTYADDIAAAVPAVADALGRGAIDLLVERARLFDGVARLLGATAEADGAAPLLVLDDLHWADAGTVALVRHLLRADIDLRLLITYRDTDLERRHPLAAALADWRREGLGTRVDLRGLDAAAVGELLFADAAAGASLRELAQAVTDESEGNPFFVIEIGRHLRETGTVAVDERGDVIVKQRAALELPEGAREAIGRRLSRLSEESNRVLGVASVLGRSFRLGDVTMLAGVDADAALSALEPALAIRVIEEDRGRPDHFSFGHALVRQTLYDELPVSRRARLHAAAGRELQARGADPSEVASHLLRAVPAVEPATAAAAALEAANTAIGRAGYEDAIALATLGLEVLDGEAPPLRCDLLLARTDARIYIGDADGGLTDALAAGELAIALDDPARIAQAPVQVGRSFGAFQAAGPEGTAAIDHLVATALEHPDLSAIDRVRLEAISHWRNQTFHHRRPPEGVLAAARELGDPEALAYALLVRVDELAEVPGTGPAQLELLAELPRLPLRGRNRGASLATTFRIPMAHYRCGNRAGADAAVVAYDEHMKAYPVAGWTQGGPVLRGVLALLDGDIARADELCTEVLSRPGAMLGPAILAGGALMVLLRREQGRSDEARAVLEISAARLPHVVAYAAAAALYAVDTGDHAAAAATVRGVLDRVTLPQGNGVRALGGALALEAAAGIGDGALIAPLYEHLAPFAGEPVGTAGAFMAPADYYLGLADEALGDTAAATARFEASAAISRRFGAEFWAAHADAARARVTANVALAASVSEWAHARGLVRLHDLAAAAAR